MAREFAKVKAGIWQDDDFRALPYQAQHLYFVILTDPELSYCGVADWRPKRMLPKSAGWTLTELESAANILAEKRLLIIDEDTEEVLVRSFLRHDGVMAHNKLCVSAATAYAALASNTIRGVVVHELRRLEQEYSDWPAWGRTQVRDVLKRNPLDPFGPDFEHRLAPRLASALAPTLGPPLGANAEERLGMPYNSNSNSNLQQQHKEGSAPQDPPPKKKPARTIPNDWEPTLKHVRRATELKINLTTESEKFINYAQANDRRQADWDKAFFNWLIKAAEYQTRSNQGGFSRPSIDRQGDLLKSERARIVASMNQQPALEIEQ